MVDFNQIVYQVIDMLIFFKMNMVFFFFVLLLMNMNIDIKCGIFFNISSLLYFQDIIIENIIILFV